MGATFWGVFFLVVLNILINSYVLNQVIKDRRVLSAFVDASQLYANAYTAMALRYNEVASAFNDVKEVSDNQADVLEAILASQSEWPKPVQEALERLRTVQKARQAVTYSTGYYGTMTKS